MSFLNVKKITALVVFVLACNFALAQTVNSPDKNLSVTFSLNSGVPYYSLSYKGKAVIKTSKLGIEAKNVPSFTGGFTIADTKQVTVDETWQPIMGEQKDIRNNYNELLVTLKQPQNNNRSIKVRFRVFNDGLGFRYEFPKQDGLS